MDTNEVREQWVGRTGAYSPDYYAYYGPDDASAALKRCFDGTVGRNAAVLELGCSVGRHLSHLHAHGYGDLSGVDIDPGAIDAVGERYPDLAADGTFYVDAIQDVVREFDDGQFDAVYSVETLQHLPPDDAWVFDELPRITDDLLVTVENERGVGTGDEDSTEGEGTDDARSAAARTDVTYVDDGIPLFFRDWRAVFTSRGMVETDARSLGRDTFRAFRTAGSGSTRDE